VALPHLTNIISYKESTGIVTLSDDQKIKEILSDNFLSFVESMNYKINMDNDPFHMYKVDGIVKHTMEYNKNYQDVYKFYITPHENSAFDYLRTHDQWSRVLTELNSVCKRIKLLHNFEVMYGFNNRWIEFYVIDNKVKYNNYYDILALAC
jgi:hypothetical protein